MGVAALGGAIAKQSMQKARDAGKTLWKNSEAGKNQEAADRLDMRERERALQALRNK